MEEKRSARPSTWLWAERRRNDGRTERKSSASRSLVMHPLSVASSFRRSRVLSRTVLRARAALPAALAPRPHWEPVILHFEPPGPEPGRPIVGPGRARPLGDDPSG